MSGFVDRENEIFAVLQDFADEDLAFVVVGGYGVSAFQHRFSVDADVVVRDDHLDDFTALLDDRGFEPVADRDLDVYGGRYLAYEKNVELPVTVDLLVNSLHCRQTDGVWRYRYFRQHSITTEIEGSERTVTVRVPERELLMAVKLHSGRLTDVRDVVALAEDVDFETVAVHLDRGDEQRLRDVLEGVHETLTGDNFEDSFKGVFSTSEFPGGDVEAVREFVRQRLE